MSEVFAFDDYELDVARFELRRNGEPVDVQPKVPMPPSSSRRRSSTPIARNITV